MANRVDTAPSGAQRYMQGIAVPASSVNPTEFFARTRRTITPELTKTYAGLGMQDVIEMKKTHILSGVFIRVFGSVTTANGTGAVASTARWPYDLIRQLRFTANGQSNIINVSGAKLKVREFMARGDLNDRGIAQTVAGATVNQGTLAQACESWGVGSRTTGIAPGTYDVDLTWFVPIADDQVDLAGAVFAASSSTDLTITIDWAPTNELFTLTGTASAAVNLTLQVEPLRYTIPLGPDGQIVVPDLSLFHSLIQSRYTDFATGENEKRMIGQGSGKTLLRSYSQIWNGATPAPIIPTELTLGRMAWRYSSNETPDEYPDSQMLRYINERMYNVDIAAVHGFLCHEFASENAFRDTVDLSTTSEWRQLVTILPAVTLNNAAMETVVESVFAAGVGA